MPTSKHNLLVAVRGTGRASLVLPTSLLVAVGVISAVALAASASGAVQRLGFDAIGKTQEALDHLAQGRYEQAEQAAQDVLSHRHPLSGRAWLIVATARQRAGNFAQAEEAFTACLSETTHDADRAFALEQIKVCRQSRTGDAAAQPPSARLTRLQRVELARTQPVKAVESSAHFVVHSYNAALSKLVAAEAETALTRIGELLTSGREYPNTVEIHIWPTRKDFEANAVDAPEWAGGSYSLTTRDGLTTRRIDLTQTTSDGQFSTEMLDRVLPHELCHLVTRESFGDAPCPLFLNEGLAMLAEALPDNGRILLAGTALAGKGKLSLHEVLLTQRHTLTDVDIFYAESYSLVAFLQSRLSERQFMELIESIKLGCSFRDALHRAVGTPQDDKFLPAVAAAWEAHAIEQAQYLRAVRGQFELAMGR